MADSARLPKVVVVGLGPAGPELITAQARDALDRASHRFVRTWHHPSARALEGATSFDDLYDSAPTAEEVYRAMASALVGAAATHGQVLYAVPGSPLVCERTVELLLADLRVRVELVAGLSFLDLAWAALGVDPVGAGVRLVDGEAFATEAAGQRGPLLVAQCWSNQVLSDIKLSVDEEPAEPVTVLSRLGSPNSSVSRLPWADLDRAVIPDHLTSVFIPSLAAPVGRELAKVGELARTLRRRCPWDAQQTHASLTRHLVEETYEVLDAIEGLDTDAGTGYEHLEEELGDLLFQVYFHATLAAEAGQFTLADVARGLHDKLVGRHPHVFGTVEAASAEAVMANWEQIKAAEKGRTSVMEGIPAGLPALLGAAKVLGRANSAGFEPGTKAGLAAAVRAGAERLADRPDEYAVGALLWSVVALARGHGVDPEAALRRATAAYRSAFESQEQFTRSQPL